MQENKKWEFNKTDFSGVYLIQPFCAYDTRGYFLKDYSNEIFKNNGLEYDLKETFYSFSKKNVVRGMHFQRQKQMPKLVRCISGEILDVVCDLRINSDTFGEWRSFILSEKNMNELLIPGGFAHGFIANEDSLVSYKCAEDFSAEYDDGIIWNDKEIGINWKRGGVTDYSDVIVSEKDKKLQTFREFVDKYKGLK